MLRVKNDRHAIRLDRGEYCVCELAGQSLLDLRAARQNVQRARKLAHADYSAVWGIPDVSGPKEWEEVVLTDGKKGDVPEAYQSVVAFLKPGSERLRGVLAQPGKELGVGLGYSSRRTRQSLSVEALTNRLDY